MKTKKSLFITAFDKSNRLQKFGWIIVFTLSLYFVFNNAFPYFDINNIKIYDSGFKPFTPFIIVHILGGIIALLIGPVQFFNVVRLKYPQLHRTLGKIFFLSVLISGSASIYLAIFDNILRKGEFTFGTGMLGLVLAWFITGGLAYWSIRKKNFIQHKEWMIRCYVVTSGFTVFRLIFKVVFLIDNFPNWNEISGVTAWACWSIPLLITESILQSKKISTKSV